MDQLRTRCVPIETRPPAELLFSRIEKHRATLITEQFLILEGSLQNIDNVVALKVARVSPLRAEQEAIAAPSHDFR